MGSKKQVETINAKYGAKFWAEKGSQGGKLGGARPFKDPQIARLAQRKSVAARIANRQAQGSESEGN